MKTVATIMALTAIAVAGAANANEECAGISDDQSRLACYDAEYRPATSTSQKSAWSVNTSTSPIDDSRTVVLMTDSTQPVRSRFGRPESATLIARCSENTTSMYLIFAGNHMTDIQSYGQVTTRVDDLKARTINMDSSTDNKALGLWRGGSSIPFLESMFGHDMLTVRATPFNESPITAQFPVTGLEEAIQPLRDACHW